MCYIYMLGSFVDFLKFLLFFLLFVHYLTIFFCWQFKNYSGIKWFLIKYMSKTHLFCVLCMSTIDITLDMKLEGRIQHGHPWNFWVEILFQNWLSIHLHVAIPMHIVLQCIIKNMQSKYRFYFNMRVWKGFVSRECNLAWVKFIKTLSYYSMLQCNSLPNFRLKINSDTKISIQCLIDCYNQIIVVLKTVYEMI